MNNKTIIILVVLALALLIIFASTGGDEENTAVEETSNVSLPAEEVESASSNAVYKDGVVEVTSIEEYKSTDADAVQEKKASEMTAQEIAQKKADYVAQLETLENDLNRGILTSEEAGIYIADLERRIAELVEASQSK